MAENRDKNNVGNEKRVDTTERKQQTSGSQSEVQDLEMSDLRDTASSRSNPVTDDMIKSRQDAINTNRQK